MPPPSKTFTVISAASTDADSPITAELMTSIADSLIHLEEWLGDSFTAAKDHDHDGTNSKKVAFGNLTGNLADNATLEADVDAKIVGGEGSSIQAFDFSQGHKLLSNTFLVVGKIQFSGFFITQPITITKLSFWLSTKPIGTVGQADIEMAIFEEGSTTYDRVGTGVASVTYTFSQVADVLITATLSTSAALTAGKIYYFAWLLTGYSIDEPSDYLGITKSIAGQVAVEKTSFRHNNVLGSIPASVNISDTTLSDYALWGAMTE